MSPLKVKILELRAEGKTYNQIVGILGCAKSTVCYYCGSEQKTKSLTRQIERRITLHPYQRKLDSHLYRSYLRIRYCKYNRPITKMITDKVGDFQKRNKECNMQRFTAKDVIEKLGENPVCYLTGEPIDISKPRTYHFDHIIPISKGGSNGLDNLGICTPQANLMKSSMTPEELFVMCEKILGYRDKNSGESQLTN